MAGLIVKLFLCPLTVFFAELVFPKVNYTAFYQPVIVGLVLAESAHMMQVFLLKKT